MIARMEKVGVNAGGKGCLSGGFAPEFLGELKALDAAVTKDKVAAGSGAVFFATDSQKELSSTTKVAKSLKDATALWIIYPKGQKSITENDVIAAGRKTGLKDVKVVGFSPTDTALKFVIPLDKR